MMNVIFIDGIQRYFYKYINPSTNEKSCIEYL